MLRGMGERHVMSCVQVGLAQSSIMAAAPGCWIMPLACSRHAAPHGCVPLRVHGSRYKPVACQRGDTAGACQVPLLVLAI